MATKGTTFKLDLGAIDRLGKKMGRATALYDKTMRQRMVRATEMVWRIAHQRRPYISKSQMKYEGRTVRASDPSAELGVPVRTGALQASVKQTVTRTKLMSFVGEVFTKGIPYAGFIEYGTSKMWPRPFMRPAVALTQEAIKRLFGLKVEGKL